MSMNPIQVLAVTGGKGGVGKTNVSVNLGIAMTRLGPARDAAGRGSGTRQRRRAAGPQTRKNLKDVLDGDAALADIIVEGPGGLSIVPAASGMQAMVKLGAREHAGLIGAFSEIGNRMDVLIIDTAAGISDEVVSFLCAAQEVMVVVCNEPTSITDAYALIKVLNLEYGIDRVRVVANMVRSDADGDAVFNKLMNVTDRFLDVSIHHAGNIPYDDYLRRAVRKQKAVVDAYPDAQSSLAFERLAAVADGWPIPAVPGGHLEFFVERLVAENRVH